MFFEAYKRLYLRGDYETPISDSVVLASILAQITFGDAKQAQKNAKQYL